MLHLSKEQLDSLDTDAERHFVERACAFLRSNATAEVSRADDGQLARFVRESRDVAGLHGVSSERGIMKWCLLRLIAGSNFQDKPEIRAFLAEQQHGEHAVRMLLDRLGHMAAAH